MNRWKLWLPVIIFISLFAWWMNTGLKKQVLIQAGRPPLIADDIWEGPDKVYFVVNGQDGSVPQVAGQKIIKGSLREPGSYLPILVPHCKATLKTAVGLFSSDSSFRNATRRMIQQMGAHKKCVGGILGGLILCIVLIVWIRRGGARNKKLQKESAIKSEIMAPRLIGISDVEALFLELFRKKIGASPGASSSIELLTSGRSRTRRMIELKVKHEGTWRRRRMSISHIGENTGSKSQCFYVIYDTHMVVKISPMPITDFDTYLAKVQAEAKILRQLAPKECVIPNISVVLKKIHTLPGANRMSADNLEEEYVRLLKISPELQRYLKVGGNFAFFMDLAKYFFLGHVVENFHDTGKAIEKEISADIEILSDAYQFENKYGPQGRAIWPDLYRAYKQFQQEIGNTRAETADDVDISEWQSKIWFLSRMVGFDIPDASVNVPDGFSGKLEQHLADLGDNHSEIGKRYLQVLKHYTGSRIFNRNRPLMGAMATNLLELLIWLNDKKVSMRDLKPDNLLVAGDSSNYPHFLKSARDYTIGLIDLETAVDYRGGTHLQIRQPQLGGTPYYATPSHFFQNQLLQGIHGDLALVLHMQDWYAIVAIIYEIIVGRRLFLITATEIPILMKKKRQAVLAKKDLKTIYIPLAHQFWENAAEEIQNKLNLNAEKLEAVNVRIPQKIQHRLVDHLDIELDHVNQHIDECLDSSEAFSKEKNRRILQQSTIMKLEGFRSKYSSHKDTQDLACQMDLLIELKTKAETLSRLKQSLQAPTPEITARALIQNMFDLVRNHMQPLAAEEMLATTYLPDGSTDAEMAETAQDPEKTGSLGYSVTIQV